MTALSEKDRRKIIDCPRCTKGTVKIPHSSGVWWKEQQRRCHFCKGSGRVYADVQMESARMDPRGLGGGLGR